MKKYILLFASSLALLGMGCKQEYNQDYYRTTPPQKIYQRGDERSVLIPSPQPRDRKNKEELPSSSSPYDVHLEKPKRMQ